MKFLSSFRLFLAVDFLALVCGLEMSPYGCSPEETNVLDAAYGAVNYALMRAIDRTERLIYILEDDYGPEDEILGFDRSTLMVFEAIFGPVYFGTDQPAERERGIAIVHHIQDTLRRYDRGFEAPSFVELRCSEDWVLAEAPEEMNIDLIEPEAWDDRPAHLGGQVIFETNANQRHRCEDSDLYAYKLWVPDSTYGGHDLLVFCPSTFARIWEDPSYSISLRELRSRQLPGHTPLDDICDGNLACSMIHELTHSDVIMEGEPLYDEVGRDNRPAYGWVRITDLGWHYPEKAGSNADSYTFYILGGFALLSSS
ncbi:predicted protein [Uncinocarpus reesii 1704]|uniref:Lysine-specific metallo-endopeptidase domain-containing protein n=1 Tax=Uncinocarpus reesii (strain UAMH 1704) TaxID=336963 RepID=C4JK97_UNCRE|nr:uncharacterized protein UREG_02054 [Uncinocarpus reesii 1704]EEP77205.1 predicted protein [Uncinocarpus reesii 1704]